MASGSMDHSLQVHRLKQGGLQAFGTCEGGHASAIASVDLFLKGSSKLLASGDWEGGVCLWDLSAHPDDAVGEEEQATKRTKTSSAPSSRSVSVKALSLTPTVSLQAHNSPVSGLSWGNCEKRLEAGRPDRLITGSWDRSVKVWDVERQDCLLTLAGSRVVTCLDTSHRASGIVATGHPDCTVRLWDVRTDKKEDSLTVTDSTFRPSHKAWVSSVQWSPHSPYHVTSTGHDGTVKLWDIRSSLPLHTVRAFAKGDKGLCLAYSPGTTENGYTIFAGGTDCAVKQVQSAGLPKQ
jgi:ribosome biogenesis protein YTM1